MPIIRFLESSNYRHPPSLSTSHFSLFTLHFSLSLPNAVPSLLVTRQSQGFLNVCLYSDEYMPLWYSTPTDRVAIWQSGHLHHTDHKSCLRFLFWYSYKIPHKLNSYHSSSLLFFFSIQEAVISPASIPSLSPIQDHGNAAERKSTTSFICFPSTLNNYCDNFIRICAIIISVFFRSAAVFNTDKASFLPCHDKSNQLL